MSVFREIIERGIKKAEEAYLFVQEDPVLSGFFRVASNVVQNLFAEHPILFWFFVCCLFALSLVALGIKRVTDGLKIFLRDTVFLLSLIFLPLAGIAIIIHEPLFILLVIGSTAFAACLRASDPLDLVLLPDWPEASWAAPPLREAAC